MKKHKVDRSNKVHTNLQYEAVKYMFSPGVHYEERRIWSKKYDYHQKIIDRQKYLGRVLTRSERAKIWKNTRPGGF